MKFTGKQLNWSPFFNKNAGWRLYEEEAPAQMFSVNFKNIYSVNGLLKEHVRKYAHVFFGIHILEEHRCLGEPQLTNSCQLSLIYREAPRF